MKKSKFLKIVKESVKETLNENSFYHGGVKWFKPSLNEQTVIYQRHRYYLAEICTSNQNLSPNVGYFPGDTISNNAGGGATHYIPGSSGNGDDIVMCTAGVNTVANVGSNAPNVHMCDPSDYGGSFIVSMLWPISLGMNIPCYAQATSPTNPSGLQTPGGMLVKLLGVSSPRTFQSNSSFPAQGITGCKIAFINSQGQVCPTNGCMDPLANNYDSLANVDNGTCTYTGCTEPTAVNYSTFIHPIDGNIYNATTDDGSCEGCTDPSASNYQSWAGVDDGSCEYEGCTDPLATNYNPNATIDDGSCIYDGCTDGTTPANNFNPNANNEDGSCEYEGCTDPTAANYSFGGNPFPPFTPQVTANGDTYIPQPFLNNGTAIDDGSCQYSGCMGDPTLPSGTSLAAVGPNAGLQYTLGAFNYDPNATIDDGSCIFITFGCVSPNATNYDPTADADDGSCIFPPNAGCTNPASTNYDPTAVVDDGTCEGCTNPNSSNFDPFFNTNLGIDDGSCLGCTAPAASNFDPFFTNNVGVDDGSCLGCTDPLASNYQSWAGVDDGSCTYPVSGCNNPIATNYNPNAVGDDGSCEFHGCTDQASTSYSFNGNPFPQFGFTPPTPPVTANGDPYQNGIAVDDGSCTYPVVGCPDSLVPSTGAIVGGSPFCSTCYLYDSNAVGCPDPNGIAIPGDTSCCCTFGCTDNTMSNYDPNACVDDGSCVPYKTPGCLDPTPITTQQLPTNNTCGPNNTALVPGTPPNPPYVFSASETTVWWAQPLAGCPDNSLPGNPPDPARTDCCGYYGCLDSNAINYTPELPDNLGNMIPTVGCPTPVGMGAYEGDPNNTCCCEYSKLLQCSCCEYGGAQLQPVSMVPVFAHLMPNGCASWNGGNYSNCAETNLFNPGDCYDCTTFDFLTYSGPHANEVLDAYNMGLQYNQVHGVLDGNSLFCNEVCQSSNPSFINPTWPCECCGKTHGCEDDTVSPKPYGCWTCRDNTTCTQPSPSWMAANPGLNYYNDEPSCLSSAPANCPPASSCANNPGHCSTNPSLSPGGACWICHMQTECMPVYDYLQYGSGPPGSTGTQSYLMNWLIPQGTNPTTYQTPQGSGLYCTEQDCMAATGCGPYTCSPPPGGCPTGYIFIPQPVCQCQQPSKPKPPKGTQDFDAEFTSDEETFTPNADYIPDEETPVDNALQERFQKLANIIKKKK